MPKNSWKQRPIKIISIESADNDDHLSEKTGGFSMPKMARMIKVEFRSM